jgi:NAD(P)-dependent dehydrogenase (short-subunit alcohol dehydrogenase family)
VRLKDKVAIITGGTAGIGRATAELMMAEGAKVIVTGRDPARASRATFMQQDTTDEQSWPRVVEAALSTYGRIDILVNNAGRLILKPLPALTHDDLRLMLAANLESVFFGVRAVWPHMVTAGGSIVNVSALLGQRGSPLGLAYGAAKAAQQAFSKAAALEGAPHNIRVNTILPGIIWSDGWQRLAGDKQEETKTGVSAGIPFKRVGEPREVAAAIAYLASDEARGITGIEMTVDGGMAAG